jgi:hypothetical protein
MHTKERISQLMEDGINRTPEEIANILELPYHKVKKVFNQIYRNKDTLPTKEIK